MIAGPLPALTVRLAKTITYAKLGVTKKKGHARRYLVSSCRPVGATIVCGFSMLMHDSQTCSGSVQVRSRGLDIEGRYVQMVCS